MAPTLWTWRRRKAKAKRNNPNDGIYSLPCVIADPESTPEVEAREHLSASRASTRRPSKELPLAVPSGAPSHGGGSSLFELLPGFRSNRPSLTPATAAAAAEPLSAESSGEHDLGDLRSGELHLPPSVVAVGKQATPDDMREGLVRDGVDVIITSQAPGGISEVVRGAARLYAAEGGQAHLRWRWYSRKIFGRRLGGYDMRLVVIAKWITSVVAVEENTVVVESRSESGGQRQRLVLRAEDPMTAYRLRLGLRAWAERYCSSGEPAVLNL